LRFTVSCRVQHCNWNLDLNIKGSGTNEDPYILEPGDHDDKSLFSLSLADSNSYIEIRSQNFSKLYLSRCNNIMISDSYFNRLVITSSSNIILDNVKIYRKICIKTSSSIDIFDSIIKVLDVIKSEDIYVSKCKIARLKKRSLLSSIALERSKIIGFRSYFQNLFY
jgi:hypothetical protein